MGMLFIPPPHSSTLLIPTTALNPTAANLDIVSSTCFSLPSNQHPFFIFSIPSILSTREVLSNMYVTPLIEGTFFLGLYYLSLFENLKAP